MKTLISAFFVLLCSFSKGQTSQSWVGRGGAFRKYNPPIPVIIVTGQSNANSHGGNLAAYFTIDPTKTSHWDSTNKLFKTYSATNALENGFETQTAGLVWVTMQKVVYVIRVAQGSLSISNWSSANGSMWNALDSAIVQGCRAIRAAGFQPNFLSTIWMQGEQDCVLGTSQTTYQTALSTFIGNLRAIDTKLSNSQFVIVKLREDSPDPTYQPGALTGINAAYVYVATNTPNVSLIRPEDIGAVFPPGDIHYTEASSILIANAWASLIPSN